MLNIFSDILRELQVLEFGSPKDTGFDLVGYTYSDFVGCKIDRKSTSGSFQFLGRRLVS